MNSLRTFYRVTPDHFFVLDQLKLPVDYEYIKVDTLQTTWKVIHDMNVRGAPLISVVATQGLSSEIFKKDFQSLSEIQTFVASSIEYLRTSRPTAVNLQNDTETLVKYVQSLNNTINVSQIKEELFKLIDSFNQQYIDACTNLSVKGVDFIILDFEEQNPQKKGQNSKLSVLTICNTGKLATPGDGTALGIVRELHKRGRLERLYIAETRPYNQGSRLTASEAVIDNLPATLITDSMAGFLMQLGKVDFVVAGADRVAKNGDTVNKIGTYTFAVLANYHKINFYIALPTQTIDLNTLRGSDIHIEERPKQELTHIKGVQIAPSEIEVWNPSFDITPSNLIKRIFHEEGEFEFDRSVCQWREMNEQLLKVNLIKKYHIFNEDQTLQVSEVGDGNLNLVFIVSSQTKSVIVKQALPYVRCVGPSWPFPLSRAHFEYQALLFQNSIVSELIPKPLLFDEQNALIIMEYLKPPFIILRKGLISQIEYPVLAEHIATFMANTHFFSSGLHLSGEEMRTGIQKWSENTQMCTLTEQVIFSDPYVDSSYNKWTSPQLDSIVSEFKTKDEELWTAIIELRHIFISSKEALIHGDLHTGSIMVTKEETKVIDPEFAFYGPIGFDIGAFLANLFLNYFSQKQYIATDNQAQKEKAEKFAEWILQSALTFYSNYVKLFLDLWNEPENTKKGSDFTPLLISKNDNFKKTIKQKYIANIFADSLGFAAAKMIRRIIGIAHVEDFEAILDLSIKANCELDALKFARTLIVQRKSFSSFEEVIELARKHFKSDL